MTHTLTVEHTAIGSDMVRAMCVPCKWAGYYRLNTLTAKHDYTAHVNGLDLTPPGDL